MRKEELCQYQRLMIEIDDLTQSIKKIEAKIAGAENKMTVFDKVKGSSPSFPWCEHSITIEGVPIDNARQIKAYKRDLEKEKLLLFKQKRRAQKQKYKIQKYIYTIQDPQIRLILKMRYIDRRTWLSISIRLGSSHESYARMAHDRWIDKM